MNHWLTRVQFVISLHFYNPHVSLFFKGGGGQIWRIFMSNMSQFSPFYISADQQPMSIQLRNWLNILKRLISTLLRGWLKAMINNEMDIAQACCNQYCQDNCFFFSIRINGNLTVTYRLSKKINCKAVYFIQNTNNHTSHTFNRDWIWQLNWIAVPFRNHISIHFHFL